MIKSLKYFLTLLIFASFLPGCTAIKAIKLINSSEAVLTKTVDSVIPFVLKGHLIIIQAEINHSGKDYTFILDTGALTMMKEKVAKKLSLPKGIKIDAAGTGGNTKKISLVNLDSVIVGGMEVKNCASGLTDFSSIFSPEIDGILGSNFLKHFKVTIDYQRKELTLSHDTTSVQPQENEIRIPIKLDMLHGFAPVTECKIDDTIKDKAIIDTGLYAHIALPVAMVKKIPSFNNGSVVTSKGSMSFGMFGSGKNEDYALRLNRVQIGDLQLQNVVSMSHAHDDGQILIGYKFLEKYIIVLNYPAEELILRPTGTPFEQNIPGYGFSITKKDQNTIVSGVWLNSDAFQKGLQPGDEIIKINSIETSAVPTVMDFILMFFADEEKSILTIEIANDTGRKTVVLHKKDLLPTLQ